MVPNSVMSKPRCSRLRKTTCKTDCVTKKHFVENPWKSTVTIKAELKVNFNIGSRINYLNLLPVFFGDVSEDVHSVIQMRYGDDFTSDVII